MPATNFDKGEEEATALDSSISPVKENYDPVILSVELFVKRLLPPGAKQWKYEKIINELSKLRHIRLDRENIGHIDNLGLLGDRVSNLYLQQNVIGRIENLEPLQHLTFLTLAGNCIEKIEHVRCLMRLALLDLSDNLIEEYNTGEFPKSLVVLNLKDNPCVRLPTHRDGLIAVLPKLHVLDEADVARDSGESDCEDASDTHAELIPLDTVTTAMLERSQARLEEYGHEHRSHMQELRDIQTNAGTTTNG